MFGLYIVSLLALLLPKAVLSSPCLAFDASFNLLVFGLDGHDWSVGTQDTWATGNLGTPTDITTTGRPPFDAANTTCYLSQFYNAIYVLSGDSANPSDVHIYNAAKKTWFAQTTTVGTYDPASAVAILDHDTNVFYAYSKGELFFLDMGALVAANSTALDWVDAKAASFNTVGYQPVMALAQNHIHFLDVPGTPAGSADIFVIHFSYFQPEAQAYSGPTFPATHGQATSFFQTTGVQQEFAFIPDDGSSTYVINVETNTTQALAGPSTKDASSTYFAGITSLVQLTSDGTVSYLPYKQGDTQANQAATWTKISSISAAVAALPPSSSASPTSTGKAGSTASNGPFNAKPTGSGVGSIGSGSSTSAAVASRPVTGVLLMASALGLMALLL
ncbi:hypothetical protein JAAARDRAFT_126000 [Jaapia argillacea MUCL 33604]|uniref:Uncharacterized protein n=1 Tax=Jaapia argillacea MUCL 33604 TaxID=933084 RepID=A0A067Q9N7_9AGAM|nr:hypothetical protein JAAARDRAFT_126000 [Jaapia argillacea MUCL 33604]